MCADRAYMTSQSYDATIGGIVYAVSVQMSGTTTPTGWFNVSAYGAAGTGLVDESTEIQAAAAAASVAGGWLVFPTGTYLFDNVDVTGDNVKIVATGDVLMKPTVTGVSGTDAHMFNVTGDNFGISGCRFDMTDEADTYDYGVYANGCDGVEIIDCQCTGGGYAFATRACDNVTIDRCRASGFKEYGICCWGDSEGITITNCKCHDTTGSVTANGIKIAGTTTGTSTQIDNVTISNNQTWACLHGIDVAINSGDHYVISDNVIYDCTDYALVFKFNTFTYLGGETGIKNATISGNAIYGEYLGVDIQREDGDPVMTGVTFVGNTVIGPSAKSAGSHPGVRVYGAVDSVVKANTVSGWRRGILVADADRIEVSNNTVVNCYRPIEVTTQDAGMTCADNVIKGNVLKGAISTDQTISSVAINIADDASNGGPTDTIVYSRVASTTGGFNVLADAGTDTDVREMTDLGSPEAVYPASVGAMYIATDGGRSSTAYIKEAGTGNTGWSIINTAYVTTVTEGTATPEEAITAAVGSMFRRTDGGAGTSLYVKESGAGNTGWVGK